MYYKDSVGTFLDVRSDIEHPCCTYSSVSSLYLSHNSKTTTWLDPRLAKKAKPPEKCEEGGKTISEDSTHTHTRLHIIPYSLPHRAVCAGAHVPASPKRAPANRR